MAKCFQFHYRRQRYEYHIRPGFLIFFLFFICLFTYLGSWQLQRYHQKQALLSAFAAQAGGSRAHALPPSQLMSFPQATLQFQPIQAEGQYRNDLTLLVQNRVSHDQLGYEVLTPLAIPGEKKLLLVDRGWVRRPSAPGLPEIGAVHDLVHVTGYIKLLNEYQFTLGKNILDPTARPILIQKMDIADISQATGAELFSIVVRLDANQPYGFVRDWTISAVPPARHLGYAVQWFVMALVLLIAYLCFCCERKDP